MIFINACRFLGLLRNQVGAVKEILKGGHYQANVAIVTRQAASGLKISADTESQSRPATPLLDSLGDLNSLGPLQCANLPRVLPTLTLYGTKCQIFKNVILQAFCSHG